MQNGIWDIRQGKRIVADCSGCGFRLEPVAVGAEVGVHLHFSEGGRVGRYLVPPGNQKRNFELQVRCPCCRKEHTRVLVVPGTGLEQARPVRLLAYGDEFLSPLFLKPQTWVSMTSPCPHPDCKVTGVIAGRLDPKLTQGAIQKYAARWPGSSVLAVYRLVEPAGVPCDVHYRRHGVAVETVNPEGFISIHPSIGDGDEL